MQHIQQTFNAIIISTSLLTLSACGGGSSSNVAPPPVASTIPNTPTTATSLVVPAESEAVLEAYLKRGLSQWAGTSHSDLATQLNQITAARETIQTTSGSTSVNFSALITQEAGVDEADTAAFDGRYIYRTNHSNVQIIRTTNSTTSVGPATQVGTITMPNDDFIQGLYLAKHDQLDDILISISSQYSYRWTEENESPWPWVDGNLKLSFYNVETPEAVAKTNGLTIQGYYIDSRRIDDTLYVVSRATPNIEGITPYPQSEEARARNEALINSAELASMVPKVIFNDGSIKNLVQSKHCFVPKQEASETLHFPTLLTISAINLRDPGDIKSVCISANSYGVYVSKDALYTTSHHYDQSNEGLTSSQIVADARTRIHKFSFSAAGPRYTGSAEVNGAFFRGNPAHYMGEHKGRLAIVTSKTFDSGHKLTLLAPAADFKLAEVASLPNDNQPALIGKPGEQIYTTNILGDRAYIVTFATTDPLYVIDLNEVKILGELEIPGFSSYLHPVSENLLLGIGKGATILDDVTYFQGLKLQLFDVSNPAQPMKVAELGIGDRGTAAQASYNPHALAYQSDYTAGIDRLALPIRVHKWPNGIRPTDKTAADFAPYDHDGLYLLELNKDDQELKLNGKIQVEQDNLCFADNQRGFLSGNAAHYLHSSGLTSIAWDTPNEQKNLALSSSTFGCYFY